MGESGAGMDLILRNARLMSGKISDIGIGDGVILALEPDLERGARKELDAEGRLVLPAFVNGQLHACKVFWRRPLAAFPSHVQALPRFEAARRVKTTYTPENVFERVSEVMRLAILHGTCAIRLFADVDEASGLNAIKGLLEVKKVFGSLMNVQVVAFPQDGTSGKAEGLMREALELGADVVGGIPWVEPDEAAQMAHTDLCFALGKEFDKDLHLVCDDTTNPGSRTLQYLARRTLEEGYGGRVAATQCTALAFYDDADVAEVIRLVKEANITVFSNPHVSLVTTQGGRAPYPRGITRVGELLAAGIPVACAQDDIDNWYYPFGRNDMLEVAQFMAHVGGFAWQLEKVLPMVTEVPARVLQLGDYGMDMGNEANLVVLDALNWRDVLQFQAVKNAVVLRGMVAAETSRTHTLRL